MSLSEHWITNRTKAPFYLRREFTIEKPIGSAVLRVCGLGQFNAYLNGKRVGDHALDPAWTDYNKLAQYVTYDVTELLDSGANALGIEVGNGWYIWDDTFGYGFHFPPFMPPNPNPYRPFGESLVAVFELDIDYADGSSETIVSDEACRTASHAVQHTTVYGSELIDGAKAQTGWTLAGYDDAAWENAFRATENEAPRGGTHGVPAPARR